MYLVLQLLFNLKLLQMKYFLTDNVLALTPNGCVGVVSDTKTKDLNDVIDFMIAEGTGLTRPQAFAYFEKLVQTIEYFVGHGHRVTTSLIRVKPSICGVFKDQDDAFDSSRHKINIRTSSGKRLMDLATKIKLEKVEAKQQNPVLRSFIDGVNKTMNYRAISDGYGTINGKRLKFDETDSRLGVFFVPNAEPLNEIPMLGYLEIRPSKLHFRIPVLPADHTGSLSEPCHAMIFLFYKAN
jgi:hypothetical protein